MASKTIFKVWICLFYLGGVLGIYLGVAGQGSLPILPLIAGVICVLIGVAFTVAVIRRPRDRV